MVTPRQVDPALLRAYQYLVALVAVHMVVLGVANVLRVLAELVLGAPSGGFTGLPFLFAEGRNQPLELYREQASLAIALLLVGGIAWWSHWRSADRAGDRASAWRAFYVNAVLFVTALLIIGYGSRTISLLLRAWLVDPLPGLFIGGFLDPDAPRVARAAGALAMVIAAAGAWWYHSGVAEADRPSVAPSSRSATLRRLAMYGLVFTGSLVALSSLSELLSNIWRSLLPPPAPVAFPGGPTPILPAVDSQRQIRFALAQGLPSALGGVALVLWHRRKANAIARLETAEGEAERGSALRQLSLALTLLVAGGVGLARAASALSATLESQLALPDPLGSIDPRPELQYRLADNVPTAIVLLLGWAAFWWLWRAEPARGEVAHSVRRLYLYSVLGATSAVSLVNAGRVVERAVARWIEVNAATASEVASLVPFALLFAVAWWYHRRLTRGSRVFGEWTRRTYQHLFLLVSLAAWAVGAAGTAGVAGSELLGQNTHRPHEIGMYVALLVVGFPAWLLQWRAVEATLTLEDLASRIRRVALALAVLGGVVALLAFGAGALFRLINALLAFSFAPSALHDLWHLICDSSVGAVVAWWHWRVLRAERGVEPTVAARIVRPFVVVVPQGDAAVMRRVLSAAGPGARAVETDLAGDEIERRLQR